MNGLLKGIGLLMIIGTVGSLELDRIGFAQALFQVLSGVMAWMVSEYRIEVRRLRRKLMRSRQVQSSMYYRFQGLTRMRTQRCARCNKRLKDPYHYWSFTTGAPRAVCKKCKEIHQPVKQRRQT